MIIKEFKALNDYILVRPVSNNNITKSGIILPESEENTLFPSVGEVLSAGEGYGQYTRQVNTGEKIAYNKGNSWGLTLDMGKGNEDFKLIRQIDVYGAIVYED